jgi:hypothetical protein
MKLNEMGRACTDRPGCCDGEDIHVYSGEVLFEYCPEYQLS